MYVSAFGFHRKCLGRREVRAAVGNSSWFEVVLEPKLPCQADEEVSPTLLRKNVSGVADDGQNVTPETIKKVLHRAPQCIGKQIKLSGHEPNFIGVAAFVPSRKLVISPPVCGPHRVRGSHLRALTFTVCRSTVETGS